MATTRNLGADASSQSFPLVPRSPIPDSQGPSTSPAELSAHLHPPSPSSFFSLPQTQQEMWAFETLQGTFGVPAGAEAGPGRHRPHRAAKAAPRSLGLELSCHKPAQGVQVRLHVMEISTNPVSCS